MTATSPLPADPTGLAGLPWDGLGRFKHAGRFPDDYPPDTLTFYSPRDDLHSVILWTLAQAQHSVALNMYGFDDDDATALLVALTENPAVYVQISLDRSQAGGVHEKAELARFNHDLFGNSIAEGQSARHAISHLKMLVVDGLYVISGSTNWSASGESRQDNELTLSRDRARCAEARAILDLNHTEMLKQMASRKAAA